MKYMAFVGDLLVFVGLVSVSILLNALVFQLLWGWYAVRIFELSPRSFPESIAIMLIVGFLTKQYLTVPDEKKLRSYAEKVLIGPLTFLISGALFYAALSFF